MMRFRKDRGWTIYDALLALALSGMMLISLNYAAVSSAAASQASKNRLFALDLIRAEIAKYQLQPDVLAGSGPVAIDVKSRSSHFTGDIQSLQVPGVSKLYQITVALKWQDRAKPHSVSKSFLVFAQEP